MKTDKKFIITISLMFVVVVVLLAYYFSNGSSVGLIKSGGNNTSNNTINNQSGGGTSSNQQVDNETVTIISLTSVKEYDLFFSLNNLINEYYVNLVNGENKVVLNKLDVDFKKLHNVNENSVKNYMINNYSSVTYFSKNIYVKGMNDVYYYFINGECQNYNFYAETIDEEENVNYLIIVDNANHTYSITPINTSESMFNYAQKYKMRKSYIEYASDNNFISTTINDEVLIVYYLNYFKNMLYLNTEKAYDMLDANTKAKYESYEDFVNNLENIYSSISTNIFSYSANGDSGSRVYNIVDKKQRKIKITEKSIMDFIITISN